MLQILSVLALPALAGDPPATPPAPAPATATAPAPVDCTTLTGDAKTQCENAAALKALQDELAKLGDCTKLAAEAKTTCDTKAAELNAKIAALQPPAPAVPDTKTGKASRSNTNRMEVENADE